jgi:YVTN family beta-propeller protein
MIPGTIRRALGLLAFVLIPGTAPALDTLVVANKAGASTWLLDPVTGEVRAKIGVGDGPHEAAISSDGRIAIVCNYGDRSAGHTLTVIDVVPGKAIRTIDLSPHRRPHGIRFLDDRRVLVTSETSRLLVEVDVVSGEIVGTHDAGGDIHMVDLADDGRFAFATAIGAGRLCAVDLGDAGGEPQWIDTGEGTEALAVRPGGREVWVGSNSEHVLKVVDREGWKIAAEIECGLQPIRLAFTNDGRHALASCILTGDLAVIDADTRQLIGRVKLAETSLDESDWKDRPDEEIRAAVQRYLQDGARPIGVLPGPDGKLVYVANRGLDHVAVIDVASWEVVRRLPTGAGPDGMAYSRIAD